MILKKKKKKRAFKPCLGFQQRDFNCTEKEEEEVQQPCYCGI
jgi:hypothetical protein